MGKYLDIQQYKQQIVDFFDNNLSEKAKADLLQHLKDDSLLQGIFENEKNVRSLIKNQVKRPKISPDFIKSITDQIKIESPHGVV